MSVLNFPVYPEKNPEIVIFACSPRQGGNTDLAVRFIDEIFERQKKDRMIIYLRDFLILPCNGCGACENGACVLGEKDCVEKLFFLLQNARQVVFFSPIYFYHLPATFKAFIDRSQSYFWTNSDISLQVGVKENSVAPNSLFVSRSVRKAWVGLWGGRRRGEKLFCGAELSLRYFLRIFGFELEPPLLLYGVDASGDILRSFENRAALTDFGEKICS